jgi:hypothetical protein
MLGKERGKSATLKTQNWHLAIELKKTYLNNPSNDHRNSTTENSPGHQNGGQPKRPRRQCQEIPLDDLLC